MSYSFPDLATFPSLKNDLIIRSARGEMIARVPVWVMRQAGRYLPEFQAIRKQHDFFKLCQTPPLAAEVTLQPIRRYSGLIDAAIIFSDILVIPQAFGMEVLMVPEKGPSFPHPIVSVEDAVEILNRKVDIYDSLNYVYEAITITRTQLDGQVPLIGFAGAPWTLFAYMIEGGGSKTFSKAKRWLYDQPDLSKQLLQKIAHAIAEHLVFQIRAGAQLVQVFDSWASELPPPIFQTFALPYLSYIAKTVRSKLDELSIPQVPLILFPKGANQSLHKLTDIGYDVIGIDSTIEILKAREILGTDVGIQGNLDPVVLLTSPKIIEEQVKAIYTSLPPTTRHIANLGHGITPEVNPDNLKVFFESIHKYGTISP